MAVNHFKEFGTVAEYEAYIQPDDYAKPLVALVDETQTVMFPQGGGGGDCGNPIMKSVDVEDFTGTTLDRLTSYITDVNIPDTVTTIGQSAFQNCSALTSIDMSNTAVTSIGNSAFSGCTSLTSVDIPSTVTSIGNSAFSGCTSLTSVDIPSTVTSIGSGAFNNCRGLTTTSFWPGSVSTVAVSTFKYCYSLLNVVLPEGVTTIEYASWSDNGAFYGCESILTVELPSTISSIGGYAFYNCRSITSYTIHATTPPAIVGSSAIDGTQNFVIYVPAESVETYKAASGWSTFASKIQAIP